MKKLLTKIKFTWIRLKLELGIISHKESLELMVFTMDGATYPSPPGYMLEVESLETIFTKEG